MKTQHKNNCCGGCQKGNQGKNEACKAKLLMTQKLQSVTEEVASLEIEE